MGILYYSIGIFLKLLRGFGMLNCIGSAGGQCEMAKSLLRTDKEIAEIYIHHIKTVCSVFIVYGFKYVLDYFLKM